MFLPYAEWLSENDRFDEAMDAFRKAGRPDKAQKLMEILTNNAVTEGRFKDASFYYWMRATETIQILEQKGIKSEKERAEATAKYEELSCKADLYYAYQHIQTYTKEPFTCLEPIVLFQVARFIINQLGTGEAPPGISRVDTLYTLAKQAKLLGAYKLARFAYDRLQKLKLPESWQDGIDLDMLTIQAKAVRDNPDLLPVCYRCGYTNQLLNPFTSFISRPGMGVLGSGDSCSSCGHPFLRSFINFEVLPLVEFVPDYRSISNTEALDMIRTAPLKKEYTSRSGRFG